MEYFEDTHFGRTDRFEIIDEFPVGYVVWNIGRHNFSHEGYVPLTKLWPGTFNVKLSTLKALKVDSEELAMLIITAAQHKTIRRKEYLSIKTKYDERIRISSV